jgi:hypothetical protein
MWLSQLTSLSFDDAVSETGLCPQSSQFSEANKHHRDNANDSSRFSRDLVILCHGRNLGLLPLSILRHFEKHDVSEIGSFSETSCSLLLSKILNF